MFRQKRADVTSAGYGALTAIAIVGAAVAWVATLHVDSPSTAAVGGLVAVGSTTQLYRTKSRSLIDLCDSQFAEPLYHDVEATVSAADARLDVRSLAEKLGSFSEVDGFAVRPSPTEDTQFVEVQLNGGRVSGEFASMIADSRGTPLMREPSSDDEYKIFVVFDK